ncbi:MAG: succinate dehydrogenase cytochrome b subunit [Elusimicrobia bacterium]|nr:succinate dehydrogenase cytochrome b subunit [Elusimicrobiota bacterium]
MQAAEAPAQAAPCRSCRAVEFLESSIGKKIMVALAGLFLCVFLLTHLAGNLILFLGGPAFDRYAQMLESNPLLPLAESGLVILFLIHIALAVRARLANMAARPVAYQVYKGKDARTPGSSTMALTGTLVLVFIIIHVATIKFQVGGAKGPDLFGHVTGWFHNPLYAGFYVVALIGVGLHLSHGVQSAFQTLGINHPRYTPMLKKLGAAFAILIALGFISIPIYFGFFNRAPATMQTNGSAMPIGPIGGAQ